MIADPQLRWVVTAALAAAAVLCGIGLVRHRGGAIGAVGHGIHVLMAVAMIDMAWPSAMVLPLPAGVVVFAAFTVFYVVATVARHYRPVNGLYHVAMMAAMSWMYAVMSADIVGRSVARWSWTTAHPAVTWAGCRCRPSPHRSRRGTCTAGRDGWHVDGRRSPRLGHRARLDLRRRLRRGHDLVAGAVLRGAPSVGGARRRPRRGAVSGAHGRVDVGDVRSHGVSRSVVPAADVRWLDSAVAVRDGHMRIPRRRPMTSR